jgi:hypothetical protein
VDRVSLASAINLGLSQGTLNGTESKWRGYDHYSDCISLELALLGNDTAITDALAPRLLSPEGAGPRAELPVRDRCKELKAWLLRPEVVRFQFGETGSRPIPDVTFRSADRGKGEPYPRFWHGHASFAALALPAVGLADYQALLLMGTLGLIAAAGALAGASGPSVLLGFAPLLVVSFAFSGELGYAQSVSYGPCQIAAWAIVCVLIARRARWTTGGLCALGVVAGSLEAFLDQMISVPLLAATFLAAVGAVSGQRWRGFTISRTASELCAVATSWVFGLVGTYVTKMLLTAVVIGWDASVGSFVQQLSLRSGTIDPQMVSSGLHAVSRTGLFLHNFLLLGDDVGRISPLEISGPDGEVFLLCLGGAGWVLAAVRLGSDVFAGRGRESLVAQAGYLSATLFALGWLFAFPEHAWVHPHFMARLLTVFLFAGWGCFASRPEAGTGLGDSFRAPNDIPQPR